MTNWNGIDTNWLNGATSTAFQSLDNVNFTDAGLTSGSTVTVDAAGVSTSQINVSNTSGNYTIQGGAVTASGALTKTGAGGLTLSTAVNAIAYMLSGGTVTTTADELLANSAPVTVGAGATLNLADHNETVGSLNLTGGTISTGTGTLSFGGLSSAGGSSTTSTISGHLTPTVASTFVVNDGSAPVDLLISAALVNGARLTFSGTGTTELSADNSSFIGGMALNGGTLILDQPTAFGSAQFFFNGGTLRAGSTLTGANAITTSVSMGGNAVVDGTNNLELGGTFVFFAGNSNVKSFTINNPNTIISGVISGTGAAARFTKTGPGKLTISNSNLISTEIGIDQGEIDATNDFSFGTATVSLIPASPNTATVNFKSSLPLIGALSSSGTGTAKVVLGDASAGPTTELSIGSGNINATYSGAIENAPGQVGSVTKVGSGQQTLAGINTYTGSTKVTESGALIISGTLNGTSNVLVDTGTLGGSGTIILPPTGQITLANGAKLAPGNGTGSTGALTVNGSVIAGAAGTIDFATGTSFGVELGATTPGGSAANPGLVDQLVLAGDLRLNDATLSGSLLTNFATNVNDLFFIVINDGTDPITGTFASAAQGSTVRFSGPGGSWDFLISYTGDSATGSFTAVGGNDIVLQALMAVPEPGALSSLLIGAGGLLGLSRRRRQFRPRALSGIALT
jgi:autotransporter-associated beta strand protein